MSVKSNSLFGFRFAFFVFATAATAFAEYFRNYSQQNETIADNKIVNGMVYSKKLFYKKIAYHPADKKENPDDG